MTNEEREQLIKIAHDTARTKGFWNVETTAKAKMALVISEIGEAIEAHRASKFCDVKLYTEAKRLYKDAEFPEIFSKFVRGTMEEELADVWIRCADMIGGLKLNIIDPRSHSMEIEVDFPTTMYNVIRFSVMPVTPKPNSTMAYIENICEHMNIDLLFFIKEKMAYNKTRENLHGKAY